MTCEVMDRTRAAPYHRPMARPAVGELVRDWRTRRRRSQLDLALDVGVSTRHLSCVETGRARPSPELVLALARHLEVPLREQNAMLLAAGYAPRYAQRSLDDPAMAGVRAALQRMLDAHDPYPGVVVDRAWNIVLGNRAALALTAGVGDAAIGPQPNVYRLCLHPAGLASRTTNFVEWAGHLLQQLRRQVSFTADPSLVALQEEVLAYPTVRDVLPLVALTSTDEPPLLVPFRFSTPLGEVATFTTLTSFGTPGDITLDELAVELFYPADDSSATALRELGAGLHA